MRRRIAGVWRNLLPKVKVSGLWRDIDIGWIKYNGVFIKFKFPFVTPGVTLVLQQRFDNHPTLGVIERRSFFRGGNGPAVGGTPGGASQGSLSNFNYLIDGRAFAIRGIESGSDPVGGVASWKWVSLQWYGNVDPNKLSKVIYIDGRTAIFKGGGYNASLDMTFLTYELTEVAQLPVGTNLNIRF